MLRVLGVAQRLRILRVVRRLGRATVTDIIRNLSPTPPQSSVSSHLRKLRASKLVRIAKRGRSSRYEINPSGLKVVRRLLTEIGGPMPRRRENTQANRQIRCCPRCGGEVVRRRGKPKCRKCGAPWGELENRTLGDSWDCAQCQRRNILQDSDSESRWCAYCGWPRAGCPGVVGPDTDGPRLE